MLALRRLDTCSFDGGGWVMESFSGKRGCQKHSCQRVGGFRGQGYNSVHLVCACEVLGGSVQVCGLGVRARRL